ncbi:DUF3800 domain-containing protein [Candidatus Marinimicrobia bacterium MT.SAG.4]|nr:DUF3800 domain-containing protein [Candidatus Marinimicrobia bacterium MT.SAG.4]
MSTCVFYVDESGDPNRHSVPIKIGTTPIFTLSALGLPLSDWRDYTSEYLQLKRRFFKSEINRTRVHAAKWEIKGSDLSKPSNKDDRRGAKFLEKVIELIERYKGKLFAVSVIKSVGHPTLATSIYTSSLQILVERLSIYVGESNIYANGIIIVDSRKKHLDRQVAESHMSFIFGSETGREFTNIIEAPLFADSQLTQGLQIADNIGSAIYSNQYQFYCRSVEGANNYEHMHKFWDRVKALEFKSKKKYDNHIKYGFRVIKHDKDN